MKQIVLLGCLIGLILVGQSCNSDVFVDEFRLQTTDAQLEGTDSSVTLRLSDDNWNLTGMLSHGMNQIVFPFEFRYFNLDGEQVEISPILYLDTLGRIQLRHSFIELDIERLSPGELKIHVWENKLRDCQLHLNFMHRELDEQEQSISVPISLSSYALDEISYNINTWFQDVTYETTKVMSILHHWEQPQEYVFFPYKEEVRRVSFQKMRFYQDAISSEMYVDPAYLLAEPSIIEIPTPRKDGFGFEMKGDKALCQMAEQKLLLPYSEQKEKVIVSEKGEFVVKKKEKLLKTENDCVVKMHNLKNGRKLVFHGKIMQETPMEYSFFTQKINDVGGGL